MSFFFKLLFLLTNQYSKLKKKSMTLVCLTMRPLGWAKQNTLHILINHLIWSSKNEIKKKIFFRTKRGNFNQTWRKAFLGARNSISFKRRNKSFSKGSNSKMGQIQWGNSFFFHNHWGNCKHTWHKSSISKWFLQIRTILFSKGR